MKIKSVKAREILDSRGNPTVEVDFGIPKGVARAAVPSGASTGVHEALELRDGGKRFLGKGVLKAVGNVNKVISKNLVGTNLNQWQIDRCMIKLDSTKNKSKLGANAILGVSIAACKAGALQKGEPIYEHIGSLVGNKNFLLPVPSMNVINGGAHAGNKLDIQEYMILPTGAKSFSQAVQMGTETYHILKNILKKKYGKGAINVGDEGGFAPPLTSMEEPLNLILNAIEEAGYKGRIKLGLDCAASNFYEKKSNKYLLEGNKYEPLALVDKYKELVKKYPIVSIEDPFDEEDFKNFFVLNQEIGKSVQIVGDDLLVTNIERIKQAIDLKACNALLLKLNQIGTVTEAIEAAQLAKKYKWNVMVSHRSGETEDAFIADLAVGLSTGQIKSGAPCRTERTAKYNQLMRIEEELGSKAKYKGKIR